MKILKKRRGKGYWLFDLEVVPGLIANNLRWYDTADVARALQLPYLKVRNPKKSKPKSFRIARDEDGKITGEGLAIIQGINELAIQEFGEYEETGSAYEEAGSPYED